MNALAGSTPRLSTTYDGRFPGPADFDAVWEAVLDASGSWQDVDCAEHLRGWCGPGTDRLVTGLADGLARVNHIGIYLGDYERDDAVLDWHAHLVGLRAAGRIAEVETGPSYISPRQYGTQGWWNSVVLPDGRAIETFACKHYGSWRERSTEERRLLMSHLAVEVRAEADVRRTLDTLARDAAHLEVIAFTEADELGHTYGHLRNNADGTVLEIVHQAPREGRTA
ncbi:hypothetical protein ACFXPX_40550 [Kitasatospora sp. NPDC059146]|uniref:hypothetical protein n=1 Tax=unclassified Kitasatospora TaxID=2633591 RepID=UPI00367CBE45